MSKIEWRAITPEEIGRELEAIVKSQQENKYAFQVGIKDLDFDVDEGKLQLLDITLPFQSIDRAEQALRDGAIKPASFLEHGQTEHQVTAFDPRPVGYSGFMDCVTHSLALTDHGLFEVGRSPAMSLSSQSRYWGWFLHRQLVYSDQVAEWRENQNLSADQFIERVYQVLVNG